MRQYHDLLEHILADGVQKQDRANVVSAIRSNPDSRRHIVTAWNPADVDKNPALFSKRASLPPDERSASMRGWPRWRARLRPLSRPATAAR